MTPKKTLEWVQSEFHRGAKVGGAKGNEIRRNAKNVFDKRFPNPVRYKNGNYIFGSD